MGSNRRCHLNFIQTYFTVRRITGIIKGIDVYLFFNRYDAVAETAREKKLFDWLAAHATKLAKGSPNRLFLLIYLVGIIVTVFLSNDAPLLLTPAVAASVKRQKLRKTAALFCLSAPLLQMQPLLSFPISNPANLVIYASRMPPLQQWLPKYFCLQFFCHNY